MVTPMKPVDPSLIVQLVSIVVQILIQLLGSPRAVADYLSGGDTAAVFRPLVMPFRWMKIRRIIRRHTDDAAAVEATAFQLDGMDEARVATIWNQSHQ